MLASATKTATGLGNGKKGSVFGSLLLVLLLSGCGGGSSPSGEIPSAGGPAEIPGETSSGPISIFPEDPAITAGSKQTFKAEIEGSSHPVTWKIEEGESGGSIGPDGTYTAPENPGTYHIVAVSEGDPDQTATTTVTVVSSPVVSVAIEPAVITLGAGQERLLTATVSGTSDTAVTWRIEEGEAGGAIGADGLYRAPDAAGDYHLVAASVADPTKSAEAVIRVIEAIEAGPRFAYAANSISNDVTIFSVDPATGALNKIGSIAAGKEPYTLTVDPSGRFVYAGNFGSNNISMYLIDQATGRLTSTGLIETGIGPYSVTVDPSGRFAYAANENSSTDVWVYRIDQTTGVLTFVETVSAGICPISMTIDPLGRFAYVANTCSNNVSIYTLDGETGKLTFVGQAAAGAGTNSVTVDPSGRFAYVSHYNSNDVWAYRIDPTTGALTKIGSLPAGRQAFSITSEPSGRYIYTANSASDNVSMFRIDPTTGALTSLGAISGERGPRSITADPSGEFIYVANLNSSTVSAFRIDPSTGLLTSVGHYPAGTQTRSVKAAAYRR